MDFQFFKKYYKIVNNPMLLKNRQLQHLNSVAGCEFWNSAAVSTGKLYLKDEQIGVQHTNFTEPHL